MQGKLSLDNNRAVIDRLWNRFVAAWFEGGKDDPKLALLRFDPQEPRSGSTAQASRQASKCCSGSIRKRNTRTKSPKCPSEERQLFSTAERGAVERWAPSPR
ncbi:pyridoxamine 5'-phosphate oxidase family protein [Mesorhizobium sp. M0030]|uniref:pyridoxamine 5'-phosphate oxidase family protein n=1 Tax=Mesorhizobium sp. M0030 TaxID=2956851 RepID=UPI00333B14CD